MANPKVFIIILNWNGKVDTLECLESVKAIDYPNFEIVVIDNASTDGSEEAIKAAFPEFVFIQTGKNLGFAGGTNVGIRYGLENDADYFWLLNNDTVIARDALSHLVETAESDYHIGMVGSKIYFHSKPDVLWYAGAVLDVDSGGVTSHVGWGQKDEGQFESVTDVGYVTGCSLLVKREVIEKIGLLPEHYFMYFEETEWNLTAQRAGFRTVMAPKSKLWHKVPLAVEIKPLFLYYMTRNRFLFIKKNKRKALNLCIDLQYKRAKMLLTELWNKGEKAKTIRFLILIIRAWIDGLILSRTGKTI